jgi:hypothetical protein
VTRFSLLLSRPMLLVIRGKFCAEPEHVAHCAK